jgi:hypothetical protein
MAAAVALYQFHPGAREALEILEFARLDLVINHTRDHA